MNDALGVRRVEGVRHLDAEIQERRKLDGTSADPFAQRLPLEQLHRDEPLALVRVDVVNGADAGMVEGGGCARFALKALERLGRAGQVLGQELEGHGAAEASVLRLVDDTHPAAAELLDDVVVGERLADHSVASGACGSGPVWASITAGVAKVTSPGRGGQRCRVPNSTQGGRRLEVPIWHLKFVASSACLLEPDS